MKKPMMAIMAFFCITLSVLAQNQNEDLYQAVATNNWAKADQLIKSGADVNYVKTAGEWMKVNLLITAVNNDNVEIVKLLLEHKADPNWRDAFNLSALMYAAAKGSKDMVVLLLSKGADPSASDGRGNSVLAAAQESKNEEVIRMIEAKLNDQK